MSDAATISGRITGRGVARCDAVEIERLEFDVLSDLARIQSLEAEWDELLDRSPCNRAFSSASWFIATCRLMPVKPAVLVARRGASLAGILPLLLSNDRSEASSLGYLIDYGDVITASQDSAAALALIDYAASRDSGYQKLWLRRFRLDSLGLAALEVLGLNHSRLLSESREGCSYIRLDCDFEEYLASRGRRLRKNLRYCGRKAAGQGASVVELEPASFPPARVPDVFLELNLARFALKSGFRASKEQEFVRMVLPDLFEKRRVRLFAVRKDERIVAIDLCMVGPNSLCLWNGGFLPEIEDISPGKLLLEAEIKSALAMKLNELDLLRGPQPWKCEWLTDRRQVMNIEIAVGQDPIA